MADPLISTAAVGHEFGPYDVTIPAERANAYAQAVGGDESPDYGHSLAPVLVVAAALTELINDLGLYSGGLQTVHAGQEVSWERAIEVGEKVAASGRLAASSVRRGNHFATIAMSYADEAGTEIGTSSTTIIVTGEIPR
ncbi:MAG: MaoC family dehydratase N-terminal domain-containing protein [Chloroflexi bacterium]|nr:MaoC family dehydratase N-terminal domain-containing protein [Chloroflexota bacterium]